MRLTFVAWINISTNSSIRLGDWSTAFRSSRSRHSSALSSSRKGKEPYQIRLWLPRSSHPQHNSQSTSNICCLVVSCLGQRADVLQYHHTRSSKEPVPLEVQTNPGTVQYPAHIYDSMSSGFIIQSRNTLYMQCTLRLFVSKLSILRMHVLTLALLCPLHILFCHPKPLAILKM
jgi:hypothetical protein